MFSELTDDEIVQLKKEITASIQSNFAVRSVSVDSGLALTLDHDNAFRFLEELSKEQSRRRRGGSRFIAFDLR